MTSRIASRLDTLEAASPQVHEQVHGEVHLLIWDVGQSFDDLLDSYGRDRIAKDDSVIIWELFVSGPPDPIHVRDRPKYHAWVAER